MSDVAIVTGGASGVGMATVDLLASRDTKVVAIDRAWPDGGRGSGDVVRITGDVTDDGTWKETVDAANGLGELNKLVINAAKLVVGTVLDVDEDDFRSVIDVNVIAAVKALKVVLPGMIERKRGAIVGVASTASFYAEQALAAYSTSKGAFIQLMRSIAVDHARDGIRTNAVCPGAINTPFFMMHVDSAPNPAEFLKEKTDRHPSGRILEPVDVAEVICFLLSDASIGMNGSAVMVDGGLTATFDFEVE